jgi:hypothetical protein
LRRHIEDVRERSFGRDAVEAIAGSRDFPPVYTASVYAGERSGSLVEVISRRADEKTIVGVKEILNSLICRLFSLSFQW